MKNQRLEPAIRLALGMFALVFLCGATGLAQSTNRSKPIPIVGNTLHATLRNNSASISESYYYSYSAPEGRIKVVLSATPPDGGASMTVSFSGRGCCSTDSTVSFAAGDTNPVESESILETSRRQTLLLTIDVSTPKRTGVSFTLSFGDGKAGGEVGSSEEVVITKTITVDGKTGLNWVDTGIEVKAGDTVRLSGKGEVDAGATWGVHEAEGTTKFADQPPGYYPVESRTRYGIAARVTSTGSDDQKWAYGDAREMRVKRSGLLWLTVNDDAPDDNTGEFIVTVTVVSNKK